MLAGFASSKEAAVIQARKVLQDAAELPCEGCRLCDLCREILEEAS